MALDTFLQVIQAETVLCNEMTALSDVILRAVMKRNHAAVSESLARHQHLSSNLAKAEAMRSRLFKQLAEAGKFKEADGMSALLARLNNQHRGQFSNSLRDFKVAVYRMRSANRALETYTNSQLVTLESFLVEILPDRDVGVYSANGSRTTSGRPLLVNSFG